MAITFPVINLLSTKVLTTKFRLMPRQSISRTGAGQALAYDFGVAVWSASYETVKMTMDDCVDFEAQLHALEGAAGTFYGWDTRRIYPRAYPTGSFVDSGTIKTLNADGKSLAFDTLPASFAINRGDYFQVTVGGAPRLYQMSESVTANGSGVTAQKTAEPHYDPATTTGLAVVFANPACVMRIEPGSVQFNLQDRALGTVSFSATQA